MGLFRFVFFEGISELEDTDMRVIVRNFDDFRVEIRQREIARAKLQQQGKKAPRKRGGIF